MMIATFAALLAAQAAPPSAPVTGVQQRFDAASKAAEEGRCDEAVPSFTALETEPVIRRSAVASAAVAVRKGGCLKSEDRRQEGEALIRKGVAVLEAQGTAFAGDVVNARVWLGRWAALRLDYPAAATEYRLALAHATDAGRVSPLLELSRVTMFDGDGEGVRSAEEALRIALALPKPEKKMLASVRTQYARALLNAGREKDAYSQLKTSLSQQGGLTLRVGYTEIQTRSDLAIAAYLSGDREAAEKYLAYTGAGRTQDTFDAARQIEGLPCDEVPGLSPDAMAVVEFALAEDGHVLGAVPVYTRAGRTAAIAFARAVNGWSWPADAAAKIPALFRAGTRVEMRCTRAGARPSLIVPLGEAASQWLVAPLERAGRTDAVLAPLLRAAIDRARAAGDRRALASALVAWAINSVVASNDMVAALAEADRVVTEANAPVAVRTYIAVLRASADGRNVRKYRDALRLLLADPGVTGDALSAATVRLLIAQPGYLAPAPADAMTLLDQVVAAPGLPARHPVKVGAMLQRANLLAAAGDVAGARASFDRTGLTGEQCALIEPSPVPRRMSAGSDDYPMSAIKLGFEGWLKVEFDIAANGNTVTPRITAAYPPFVFNDAALGITRSALYTSSFRPDGNMACTANSRGISFRIP